VFDFLRGVGCAERRRPRDAPGQAVSSNHCSSQSHWQSDHTAGQKHFDHSPAIQAELGQLCCSDVRSASEHCRGEWATNTVHLVHPEACSSPTGRAHRKPIVQPALPSITVCKTDSTAGSPTNNCKTTTDLGQALIDGNFDHAGKIKGPILRDSQLAHRTSRTARREPY
jgi:hypothetical protein